MKTESSKRSFAKSVSYRILSSLITFFAAFALTASKALTLKIGLSVEISKFIFYYLHERLWASTAYGNIYRNGRAIWFTGLSGSGKSSIANSLAQEIQKKGYSVQILDGDKIRDTINKGLGFSAADRERNIFNIAHIAKLLNEAGVVVLVPVISPYHSLREIARKTISNFIGVYVRCPIEVCEARDPKGLYKKVRSGEIKQFTGISDPYEEPTDFDITVDTSKQSLDVCVNLILKSCNL